MKVAHFVGLRKLEIVELPRPRLSEPDHVLLRIDRVGVCGSDIHYYLDGRIGPQVLSYPATLGHECAGTVVEVGAEVEGLRPGDRVAVDPAMACGTCDQCRAGRSNTCRHAQFMGGPSEALGAVAEYRVVPAENCLPISDAMTLDDAALVEPLTVALHALRLGEVASAARIAVLGAGPIGLSVLLVAKAVATCTVYVTDLLDRRLEVARQCGADWTGNAGRSEEMGTGSEPQRAQHGESTSGEVPVPISSDVTAAILQQEPSGLDVVFECSGDPRCIDQGQELLAPGGTLVMVGIPPTEQVSFDVHQMRRKELTFKNVRRQCGCIAPVIRMVSEGRINPRPLLTHRFPLERIGEAFELVAGYRDGVIKAVIDVSSAP